jgi:hypothetical protein
MDFKSAKELNFKEAPMNKSIRIGILIILATTGTLVVSGCEMPSTAAGTQVWIDVPVDGITVPEGTLLQIEGHASSPGGVTRIEIWIDGVLRFEVADPVTEDNLSRFSQEWAPPGAGGYTIQVLAISGDGTTSEPDNARVQVGTPIAELSEPDLTVTVVSLVDGDRVQCDYSNLGAAALPEGRDVWIDIHIGASEAEFVQIAHSNIGVDHLFEAGDSGNFTSAPISPAPAWPQLVSCSIDVGNLVAESNEGNNDMQLTLGAYEPEPDLTITGVSLVGEDIVQCDYSNLGGAVLPEGREVWIDIFIGPSEAEFIQTTHSNIGVGRLFETGDSGYFTSAPISPAPAWPQLVSCLIDAGDLVAESDEGNNAMQRTLGGSHLIIQETTVRFWVEPEQIQAGACANLYWEVENAQSVMLGSTEVKPEGRYEACHCKDELYRLTVTDLNGVTEEHRATIRVTGDCTSPQAESGGEESTSDGESSAPSGDSKPPSAPNQLKPVNGVDLGCIPSTMLRWEAVSDDSGIAEYQVEMQRHAGDNNWTNASGSPFTGIGGLQKEISVECGWEYRWRVRAIDGAGNSGNWSGWFTFVIPLT